MPDDQDKLKPEEGSKEFNEKFPLRESYSPEKDDLDSNKPPQGSGVPPKNSADKKDD